MYVCSYTVCYIIVWTLHGHFEKVHFENCVFGYGVGGSGFVVILFSKSGPLSTMLWSECNDKALINKIKLYFIAPITLLLPLLNLVAMLQNSTFALVWSLITILGLQICEHAGNVVILKCSRMFICPHFEIDVEHIKVICCLLITVWLRPVVNPVVNILWYDKGALPLAGCSKAIYSYKASGCRTLLDPWQCGSRVMS